MNELAIAPARLDIVPVDEIRGRVTAIKALIRDVMVKGVHYGEIPGIEKPALFGAGADQILAMFRIGVRYRVEDLSTQGTAHFRVACEGITPAGELLGEGLGEASTDEEKYRWRKAVCKEEFDRTPEAMRRTKYGHAKGGGFYTVDQVMTSAADSANTVLKMACKRAKLAMCLTVTGCTDSFTQPPLNEPADDHMGGQEDPPRTAAQPQRRSETKNSNMAGERAWLEKKAKETGRTVADILGAAGLASMDELTPESFARVKQILYAA